MFLDPLFREKMLTKKGTFQKIWWIPKESLCLPNHWDCLLNRLINQCLKLMVQNAQFLTKNNYLEDRERVNFCKIFDVFEKNVDKKGNSRRILKALFRPKTLIKRDLIKMEFDCKYIIYVHSRNCIYLTYD